MIARTLTLTGNDHTQQYQRNDDKKCPQQLPIRELLAKAHETLSEK